MKKKAGKTLSALFKRIKSKAEGDFHNNIMKKSVKIKVFLWNCYVFCGIVMSSQNNNILSNL